MAAEKLYLIMANPPLGADKTISPKRCKKFADLRSAVILVVCLLAFAACGAGGDGGAGPVPEGWWIGYPDHHQKPGSPVDHPTWALEPLEEKPVIIFIHRIGCPSCIRQDAVIHKVLGDLGDEVAYVDILADNQHQKAWDGLVIYDPGGRPGLVPLTAILTLVPGPEGTQVAWQSATGYLAEGWVRSRLDDAIRLHSGKSEAGTIDIL